MNIGEKRIILYIDKANGKGAEDDRLLRTSKKIDTNAILNTEKWVTNDIGDLLCLSLSRICAHVEMWGYSCN